MCKLSFFAACILPFIHNVHSFWSVLTDFVYCAVLRWTHIAWVLIQQCEKRDPFRILIIFVCMNVFSVHNEHKSFNLIFNAFDQTKFHRMHLNSIKLYFIIFIFNNMYSDTFFHFFSSNRKKYRWWALALHLHRFR